jgi:hypothetical protein
MRTIRSRTATSAAAVAVLMVVAACGGSPTASTPLAAPGPGVTVVGTVAGLASSSSDGVSAFSAAAGEGLTVTVAEAPHITTTVGADGSFVLRGLPEGSFTLLFTDESGNLVGSLSFDEVRANQEITVTIDVVNGEVVLVEERRDGIAHGDLEVQGYIEEIVSVDPTGDSLFVIAGYDVVARPGVTALWQGNLRLSVEDFSVGDKVHVKAVWLEPEPGQSADDQQLLAHEIFRQREEADEEDEDQDEEQLTICHIPPGNPSARETLVIGAPAWPAHEAHGDTLGPCAS